MGEPTTCPNCNAVLDADPRYRVWCPACEWNMADPPAPRQLGWLDAKLYALSIGRSEGLAAGLAASPALLDRRRRNVGALALAALVHATTAAILAGGIALFLQYRAVPGRVAAVLLVAAGLGLVPKPPRLPKGVRAYRRAELPLTFALVDRVAAAVGTSSVDRIILDVDFNAAVFTSRRGRVLRLGLLLVRVLPADQTTALLGHELGHFVSGDPLRGWFVHGAWETLLHWRAALTPERRRRGAGDITTLPVLVLSGLLWVVSWPLRWFMYGFRHVLWRSSQLGEYRADRTAARLAGAEATVGLLSTLTMARYVGLTVHRAVLGGDGASVWTALRAQFDAVPASERERLRRASCLPGRATDTTHPPDAHRMAVVQRTATGPGSFVLSAPDHDAVWGELEQNGTDLEERLIGRLGYTRPIRGS